MRNDNVLDWLDIIEKQLAPLSMEAPIFGRFPKPNVDDIEEALKNQAGLSEFQVQWESFQPKKAPMHGFGPSPICLSIQMNPFDGFLHLLLSQDHLEKLTSWVLTVEASTDNSYAEAALRFITLEALSAIHKVAPFDEFSSNLSSFTFVDSVLAEKDNPSQCLDITITYDEQNIGIRIIVDEVFRKSWKRHWQTKSMITISPEVSQNVPLTIHFNAGQVELLPKELKDLREGDWLFLETSGFGEDLHGAYVTLEVADTEIGKGIFQDNKVIINQISQSPLKILMTATK